MTERFGCLALELASWRHNYCWFSGFHLRRSSARSFHSNEKISCRLVSMETAGWPWRILAMEKRPWASLMEAVDWRRDVYRPLNRFVVGRIIKRDFFEIGEKKGECTAPGIQSKQKNRKREKKIGKWWWIKRRFQRRKIRYHGEALNIGRTFLHTTLVE